MTLVENLARFITEISYEDLSHEVRKELKIRVLDSLGCAIGALKGDPIQRIRAQVEDFGGFGYCTLIGGGKAPPDHATLYNGALVRYLDFNDSYLAKGETCHPSDNLAAVLAASEYAKASGKKLLTALAAAYLVQCRLSDVAPVRQRGFDHTVQGSYSVAAGVSKALGLGAKQTAHAIAISGTATNALRVTRTGRLSHWKGLAFPFTAFGAANAAFLAMRGITGPMEVFEGNKGFMDSIAGPFEVNWSMGDLEAIRKTIIKKYNAEIHSQPSIEGILELKAESGFTPERIEKIEIDIFDVAFHIIGGGEEGDKTRVRSKEEADHSLPYMVAAAVLDGNVMPEQYHPDRIERSDIQDLLQKVIVRPNGDYSRRFPEEMPTRITVFLEGGERLEKEKKGYEGFHARPMSWEQVVRKFNHLSAPHTEGAVQKRIIDTVARLEDAETSDLVGLLEFGSRTDRSAES
ncbi:MAG: MmgE/PrpD family protein [Desulfobacteraceae bacterium]|nr:MAG: MmgE/PrpD family protein [Desulfobacteraceae bacterium]